MYKMYLTKTDGFQNLMGKEETAQVIITNFSLAAILILKNREAKFI